MTGQTPLDLASGVTLEFCAKYNELSKRGKPLEQDVFFSMTGRHSLNSWFLEPEKGREKLHPQHLVPARQPVDKVVPPWCFRTI